MKANFASNANTLTHKGKQFAISLSVAQQENEHSYEYACQLYSDQEASTYSKFARACRTLSHTRTASRRTGTSIPSRCWFSGGAQLRIGEKPATGTPRARRRPAWLGSALISGETRASALAGTATSTPAVAGVAPGAMLSNVAVRTFQKRSAGRVLDVEVEVELSTYMIHIRVCSSYKLKC